MKTIKDLSDWVESFAPASLAESYDNPGLVTGDPDHDITGILLTLDITEQVLDEAILKGCNTIIAHHPVIFSPIKKLTGNNFIERIIIKAIKNSLNIYIAHTNLDNIHKGVNHVIAEKTRLINTRILAPKKGLLQKLIVFCPLTHSNEVRNAIFLAGGGEIGNYDECSFNIEGSGTFRASEGTRPFVGEKNKRHQEREERIEVILPAWLTNQVLVAMKKAHPYEEVAYDLIPLLNQSADIGSGMVGDLEKPIETVSFLNNLKSVFRVPTIRCSNLVKKEIKKVALCGGSGSFLLPDAIRSGADIFITGDFKYHQFFEADQKIIIADIGHFETEQFTPEIFFDLLNKKNVNFAVRLSEINTNPINYL